MTRRATSHRTARRLAGGVLATTTALGVLAGGGTPASAADPTGEPAARWGSTGRWITDDQGRVVITHGINQVTKTAPFAPDAVGFGEDDAAFLARQGFTSVRLGVIWAAVEPKPGQYDDAYLARIQRTVNTLSRHGISSLLDFHQDMFNEKFQGNGMPDWAVQDGGAPNIKAGFPGNYFFNLAVQNSFDAFHDNKPGPDGVGLADHYAGAWAHVAKYFRGTPGVMGFDLYNEPWPGKAWLGCIALWGCPIQDGRLQRVQQRSIDAIRKVDPSTTIYYEPMQFFNIGIPTHVKPKGTNLALSFHDYCTAQAITKTYLGCKVPDSRVFANAEKHSREMGRPTLLTEFGAIKDPGVLRGQTDLAMKNRVGYQYWAYTGGDPTTAGPGNEQALVFDPKLAPKDSNVDWGKLSQVAVPHPYLVAGTPQSYSFDRDAGVFRLRWTSAKVGGGTFPAGSSSTIVVPDVAVPKGYTVKVTGGTVTSASDARRLTVRLDPGATTVDLTLTRR